jgi:hypothetical protein
MEGDGCYHVTSWLIAPENGGERASPAFMSKHQGVKANWVVFQMFRKYRRHSADQLRCIASEGLDTLHSTEQLRFVRTGLSGGLPLTSEAAQLVPPVCTAVLRCGRTGSVSSALMIASDGRDDQNLPQCEIN